MERQVLLTLLSAAVTAMLVAAALGSLSRRNGGGGRGWVVGVVALLAGVIAGSRVALEKWAMSPGQSAEWIPHMGLAAGAVLIAGAVIPARWWWARAGAAGLAGAAVMCGLALARLLGRLEPPDVRWGWWAGIAVGSAALACVVAGAYRRVEREAGSGRDAARGWIDRLRDDHWPTVAMGLVLGFGALAILFAGETMKLTQLTVGLAGAWAGLAIAALTIRPGIGMGGAGAAAATMLAGLWCTAYFTHDPARPAGLALGLGAVAALIIGTRGPVARRGGWARVVIVGLAAMGMVGGACALYGPAYLKAIQEMQDSGYGR